VIPKKKADAAPKKTLGASLGAKKVQPSPADDQFNRAPTMALATLIKAPSLSKAPSSSSLSSKVI
jgi:hypothetical protein